MRNDYLKTGNLWPNGERVGLVIQRLWVQVSGEGGVNNQCSPPPSIPRLRFPWVRHRTHNCSPGGGRCNINGFPLLRMCVHGVCVCSLLCVCTLGGLIAEHKYWVWVTILGRMSHHHDVIKMYTSSFPYCSHASDYPSACDCWHMCHRLPTTG